MMNGICLIGGVNCAGKGLATSMLQNVWDAQAEQGVLPEALFAEPLSVLMMNEAGFAARNELIALNLNQRLDLRQRALQPVIEASQDQPVFLDMHFAYEDGEIADYSFLHGNVRSILMLASSPEIIYERVQRSLTNDGPVHPGRIAIAEGGVDFASAYQGNEIRSALRFAREARKSQGRIIPIVELFSLDLDGSNSHELRLRAEREFPTIVEAFKENRHGIETMQRSLGRRL